MSLFLSYKDHLLQSSFSDMTSIMSTTALPVARYRVCQVARGVKSKMLPTNAGEARNSPNKKPALSESGHSVWKA